MTLIIIILLGPHNCSGVKENPGLRGSIILNATVTHLESYTKMCLVPEPLLRPLCHSLFCRPGMAYFTLSAWHRA